MRQVSSEQSSIEGRSTRTLTQYRSPTTDHLFSSSTESQALTILLLYRDPRHSAKRPAVLHLAHYLIYPRLPSRVSQQERQSYSTEYRYIFFSRNRTYGLSLLVVLSKSHFTMAAL